MGLYHCSLVSGHRAPSAPAELSFHGINTSHKWRKPLPMSRVGQPAKMATTVRSKNFLVKTATGYRPLEYVQTLRVEEAKQMLSTGDVSTDEIGSRVGYDDPRSFRRTFKRFSGLAPRAYGKRFAHARYE